MTEKKLIAEYEIQIMDPKKAMEAKPGETGYVRHKVRVKEKPNDKLRNLSRTEENDYALARMVKKYGDLDFEKDAGKACKFIFIISQHTGWTFADTPIKEKNGGHLIGKRISSTVAVLDFPASERRAKIEYELCYINEKGKAETHDPIISNGSIPPLFTLGKMLSEGLKSIAEEPLEENE